MIKSILTFKEPSKLRFETTEDYNKVLLSTTKRGDVFLREGAICMTVEMDSRVQNLTAHLPPSSISDIAQCVPIINLQTGRVWYSRGDDRVEFIRATVRVDCANV